MPRTRPAWRWRTLARGRNDCYPNSNLTMPALPLAARIAVVVADDLLAGGTRALAPPAPAAAPDRAGGRWLPDQGAEWRRGGGPLAGGSRQAGPQALGPGRSQGAADRHRLGRAEPAR